MSVTPSGPTRAALFVERDPEYVLVERKIRHHCTRDEWNTQAYRQAAIATAWRLADNIRSEGDYLVTPSPVTLYREPFSGAIVCADIQTPQDDGPRWIDAQGVKLLAPPSLLDLKRERTTYAQWAEGPLPYAGDHEAIAAPDPFLDRETQQVRHQNRWLRTAIDDAAEPALDPIAREMGHPEFVDFRVRGIFRRRAVRVLETRQDTGGSALNGDAKVILDGQRFAVSELMQED